MPQHTKLSSESITGVNVAGAMELPHEVQDRCGGLGGPPKPGRVSGGQHHQLTARDEVARCPGDRTTAERVLFAPYHQLGMASWCSSPGRTRELRRNPTGDSNANGETKTRISALALDAAIESRPVATIRSTSSG